MTDIRFDRLQDLAPREAWAHEALAFTPWLAANIDHLSDAIGIPLELTGQEVRVETFAADILARNPQDDSVVLIENQLKATDHTHLGQIMTYLAGLQAQTVVWIAPAFREPHLSAIRWLNEHTAEGFSFFAVKLRVVRIADSPYAPIFEVIEKPNDWERDIQRVAGSKSALTPHRSEYWAALAARYPDCGLEPYQQYRFAYLDQNEDLWIGLWAGSKHIGIFLASESAEDWIQFEKILGDNLPLIESRLGKIGRRKDMGAFNQSIAADLLDKARWPDMMAWHYNKLKEYRSAFEMYSGV